MVKFFSIILFISTFSFNAFSISTEMKAAKKNAIYQCQNDTQQYQASGMSKSKFNKFCVCYMEGVFNLLNNKEMKYQEKYGKPSDKFYKGTRKIVKKCS